MISWWDVPAAREFRAIAFEYLSAVDASSRMTGSELFHRVHVLLPQLYVAALKLPERPEESFAEPGDDYTVPSLNQDASDRRHARRQAVMGSIQNTFEGSWEHYQEMFDPYDLEGERPVVGSLSDDLADIYMDLSEAEEEWQKGDYASATWKWRFNFEAHWSEHLTSGLRAIRALAATHDVGFPPIPSG